MPQLTKSQTHCDMTMGVYYDVKGAVIWYILLLWWGSYYFYYKEIVHSISNKNKQFYLKYIQKNITW